MLLQIDLSGTLVLVTGVSGELGYIPVAGGRVLPGI